MVDSESSSSASSIPAPSRPVTGAEPPAPSVAGSTWCCAATSGIRWTSTSARQDEQLAKLRHDLAESERRRALAEQHATATENEIRSLRSDAAVQRAHPARGELRLPRREAAAAGRAGGGRGPVRRRPGGRRGDRAGAGRRRAAPARGRAEPDRPLVAAGPAGRAAHRRAAGARAADRRAADHRPVRDRRHARGRPAGRRAAAPAGRGATRRPCGPARRTPRSGCATRPSRRSPGSRRCATTRGPRSPGWPSCCPTSWTT